MTKPRTRFCWLCGRKLRGNHFREVVIQGHPRVVHKACAEMYRDEIERDNRLVEWGKGPTAGKGVGAA